MHTLAMCSKRIAASAGFEQLLLCISGSHARYSNKAAGVLKSSYFLFIIIIREGLNH